MEDWEFRHKKTSEAHRDLQNCAYQIDELIRRLDGAYMTKLSDLISDVPGRIEAASKMISGNEAEAINERIRHGENTAALTLKALLKIT